LTGTFGRTLPPLLAAAWSRFDEFISALIYGRNLERAKAEPYWHVSAKKKKYIFSITLFRGTTSTDIFVIIFPPEPEPIPYSAYKDLPT
jgi:hypothetical protein